MREHAGERVPKAASIPSTSEKSCLTNSAHTYLNLPDAGSDSHVKAAVDIAPGKVAAILVRLVAINRQGVEIQSIDNLLTSSENQV